MTTQHQGHHGKGNSGGGHHVVSLEIYRNVFLALIAGTVITVAASYVDFGTMNIFIAMLIATIKAMLVILFFMGLKYEGYENNVTFFCSFGFLALFVGLTSADIFTRIDLSPVKVDASELQSSGGGESVDVTKLQTPNPELLSKAKATYSQQCATCHGVEGKGDGPAAGALNPKPRNFTSVDGWKNPKTLSGVLKTLTHGLPGTPMPSFGSMSVADRFALAHFVRSIMPSAPADSATELAQLAKDFGGGGKRVLPIDWALEKLSRESAGAR